MHEPNRCTGHVKGDDESGMRPCRRYPIRGGTVCTSHGGRAPQVKAKALRRLAEGEARKSIADVEVRAIDNPLDALADLAAEQLAWKDHLANVVADLKASYRFQDDKGSEQLDARVRLYTDAMTEARKYLTDWVRLGFEERKAQLDDARAMLVRTFAVGLIVELGHELEEPAVRAAFERWAPVLDGAPPPVLLEVDAVEVSGG